MTMISSGPRRVVLFITLSLCLQGCQGENSPSGSPSSSEKNEAEAHCWTPAQNRPWTELTEAHDFWGICFIQGSRVGATRTQVSPAIGLDGKPIVGPDGKPTVQVSTRMQLRMQRFGETSQIESTIRSIESLQGELVSFIDQMQMGGRPRVIQGNVEGNRLILTEGNGKRSLDWSPQMGSFLAVEHALLSSPMKPGERRRLKHLVQTSNSVETVDLVAKTIEPVPLLHGTYQLLRIDMTMTLPGKQKMSGTIWTDAKGLELKSRLDMLNQELYRVTKEEALADYEPGKLDLGFDMLVKPNRPIKDPHAQRLARYVVTLTDDDPAAVFPTGPSQSVEPIDAHTARLVVRAVRPSATAGKPDPNDLPGRADLAPNHYMESNDPVIQAMAKDAVKDATTPWEKAVALERHVHRLLEKADYTQVFSTAAETAKSRRGDCSEHAVLLAALGRASDIPSRIVVGLVYSDSLGAFGFHTWTEMYLDGSWIPMDATLGRRGIGVGHLQLGHTTLENGLADPVFFALPKTLGKLKIKVEEEKKE